jgi:flagellin
MITINQTVAATAAIYTSTSTLSTGVITTGNVSLNGVQFTLASGASLASVAAQFNSASGQTGVTAAVGTNNIIFTQTQTGTNRSVNFTDQNGSLSTAANTQARTVGVDATATITVGGQSVLFTGGQQGSDGLTLQDINGNKLNITSGGNTVNTQLLGQVIAADSTFQIGFQSTNTASLSLRNMSAGQLGSGVVSGLTVNNLDVTSSTGAQNALAVLDKAIDEVSQMRGRIGNFQRNVVETQQRSLSSMRENLANSESSIRDLDVASEMTNYTKFQVMQQAGLSILSQANQQGSAVLSLLR